MPGALPDSGPISQSQINTAIGGTFFNMSLAGAADSASFLPPDQMSDFYGFSPSPSVTQFRYNTGGGAKLPEFACANTSYNVGYHDGSGTLPVAGDELYSDNNGNNPLNLSSGWYGMLSSGAGLPSNAFRITGSSANNDVQETEICII